MLRALGTAPSSGAVLHANACDRIDLGTIACELVTPLFGGGVQAGVVDRQMPVRASAFRGQLRFWWRLWASQQPGTSAKRVAQAECTLWGGISRHNVDAGSRASLVRVQVTDVVGLKLATLEELKLRKEDVGYVLFGAETSTRFAAPGLRWNLKVSLERKAETDVAPIGGLDAADQVLLCLRWWSSFGGLGARQRRGAGAIRAQSLPQITAAEAQRIGCEFTFAGPQRKTHVEAWIDGIRQLRNFRQGPGVGRNPGNDDGGTFEGAKHPGRSRWPEPAAVRKLTGQHRIKEVGISFQPAPDTPVWFPRAQFGLPIIMHFKGAGGDLQPDPKDVHILPFESERMASPLILRPIATGDGGGWRAAALVLPRSRLAKMSVRICSEQGLSGGKLAAVNPPDGRDAEWQSKLPARSPLDGHADALAAFMHYLRNEVLKGAAGGAP